MMARVRTYKGFMKGEGLLEKPIPAKIQDGSSTIFPLMAALFGGEVIRFSVVDYGEMRVFITGVISDDQSLNCWRIQGRIISTSKEDALTKIRSMDGKLFEGYYNILNRRGSINIGSYW